MANFFFIKIKKSKNLKNQKSKKSKNAKIKKSKYETLFM